MLSPKGCYALYLPSSPAFQSTPDTDGYVWVSVYTTGRSPHRPTLHFLRIHGNGASCSCNCIMPDNRSIDAHLLHPHASMPPILGPSKAFIEEAHVQQEKPCCVLRRPVPFLLVAPSIGTAGGHRKPIFNRPGGPAYSSHRCLRAIIDTVSRASSPESCSDKGGP